jgi:membrane-associated protease RseP (regulator of RpoE activity)
MQKEQFANSAVVTCPNCRASLTAGLRFCRMCGYRLGEGLEEYNETRRFDAATAPAPPAATSAGPRPAEPFAGPAAWGMAPMAPMAPMTPAVSSFGRMARVCNPARMGWLGWLVITLAIIFAVGGGVKMIKGDRASRAGARPPQIAVSVLDEVDGFDTADGGGVFIVGLDGPDTSIERAGMVGGDIIVSLDGQPVHDVATLRRVLASIPPGKAVPVTFIRDGETKTTTLPTAPRSSYRGMAAIEGRPGGRGVFGVDVGDRVRVPGLNIYGVELDGVNRNGPGDLAGLKGGDVIVEINGKPIRTPGDLRLRIYEAVPGESATVVVVREGQRVEIPVKVGRSRGR